MDVFRSKCEEKLRQLESSKTSKVFSVGRYAAFVAYLRGENVLDRHLRHLIKIKRFRLMSLPDLNLTDALMIPKDRGQQNTDDPSQYLRVVSTDNIFEVVHSLHTSQQQHCGYKKLEDLIRGRYYGISRSYIRVHCKECPACQLSSYVPGVRLQTSELMSDKPEYANVAVQAVEVGQSDALDQTPETGDFKLPLPDDEVGDTGGPLQAPEVDNSEVPVQEPEVDDNVGVMPTSTMMSHRQYMDAVMEKLANSRTSPVVTDERYSQIILAVTAPHLCRDPGLKYWAKIKKFKIMDLPALGVTDALVLPKRKKSSDDTAEFLRVVPTSQVYDLVSEIHSDELHHAGYKKCTQYVLRYYSGITRSYIQEFCKHCSICRMKQLPKLLTEPSPPTSVVSSVERGHLELVDMSHAPDGHYSCIAHFLDLCTKFHVLFPLKTKSAEEISQMLEERVFAYLGPRHLFLTDNERDLDYMHMLQTLLGVWSVEVANVDEDKLPNRLSEEIGNGVIEDQIASIRSEIDCCNDIFYPWASWLPRIMFSLNHDMNESNTKTPYQKLFPQHPVVNCSNNTRCDTNMITETGVYDPTDVVMTSIKDMDTLSQSDSRNSHETHFNRTHSEQITTLSEHSLDPWDHPDESEGSCSRTRPHLSEKYDLARQSSVSQGDLSKFSDTRRKKRNRNASTTVNSNSCVHREKRKRSELDLSLVKNESLSSSSDLASCLDNASVVKAEIY